MIEASYMRYVRVFIVLVGLLFFSCDKNPVEKPKELLSEEVMIDILYDTALLQASNGQVNVQQSFTDNNIRVNTFIYNKYKIDSATYYQNHKYYAANLSKYKKMYEKVISRLETAQAKLDSLDGSNAIDFKEEVIKKNGELLD